MKLISNILAALLGLAFIAFGLLFFFGPPPPSLPPGSPPAMFMGAMFPTHYLHFVKVLDILGGALVLVPKTRNLGLLVLGPIIVNILAFHVFLTKGSGLTDPPVVAIALLSAFVLFSERKTWLGLIKA